MVKFNLEIKFLITDTHTNVGSLFSWVDYWSTLFRSSLKHLFYSEVYPELSHLAYYWQNKDILLAQMTENLCQ